MADAYYGEIRLFAGNFPPLNWAWCNGQAVSIQQYQALYSIVGDLYGVNLSAGTFNLPNLCSAPVGWGQGAGLSSWSAGQQAGSATSALNSAQMPNHTHVPQGTAGLTANSNLQSAPTNAVWTNSGDPTVKLYARSTATPAPALDALMDARAVGVSGGSGAHNNIQPCIGIYYIICLFGDYYPVRP